MFIFDIFINTLKSTFIPKLIGRLRELLLSHPEQDYLHELKI